MKRTVAIERLGSFIEKTSRINYVFIVLLSVILRNASVSLKSIYLTGYGLNSRNAGNHINVGLQLLQLACVILNWSTGKWVNTLFAGILSLEFVVHFVTAIVCLKSPSRKASEFVLYSIFETASQILLFTLLFIIEVLALLYPVFFSSETNCFRHFSMIKTSYSNKSYFSYFLHRLIAAKPDSGESGA